MDIRKVGSLMTRIGGLIFAVTVLTVSAQDGKGPSLAKVLAKTGKEKKFSFKITGGAEAISGEVDNGGVHYVGASAEVAGKGGVSHAMHDGKWVDVGGLIASKAPGYESVARLAQLSPPHTLVSRIASYVSGMQGDGNVGFTGELQTPQAKALAKESWIGNPDLTKASTLKASVAISAADERVVKVEIRFSGSMIEMTNTGSYYGKPDPENPPTPPAANWQLGPDGYWYEGKEKAVNVTVTLEFSNYGSATLPEDLKKKFGIKQ
jgi:hypothetical protein